MIATYQTLDQSSPHAPRADAGTRSVTDTEEADPTFFQKHYPPGYFDVIVIDECHRSAWGDWFVILERNQDAIQVGLTATPREIQLPECEEEETKGCIEQDRRLLADNIKYFSEPVYDYPYLQGVADGYLAPVDIKAFDLFHDGHLQPERLRGVQRADVADKKLSDVMTGKKVAPDAVPVQNTPSALEAKLIMPDRVGAMCRHLFEQLLETGDGNPLQKTIIFCASDHHADLIAIQLNNLYNQWCRDNKQQRVPMYAFKCMASSNGEALIPDFRGRERSHIVATTKDLLTTGVNVPCVKNIVFFRYVQSPILFHQMVGRGTRIQEPDKLMFRIFDYTGATALFGSSFVSPPPPSGPDDGGGPAPPRPDPPPRIRVRGVSIEIKDAGNFNVMGVDGRLARVTAQQYQARLVQELIALVPSLAAFRGCWLQPARRAELMEQLGAQNLLPERLREASDMDDYDLFDVIASAAYGVEPMTRAERVARFGPPGPAWLADLPEPAGRVIRAVARQFEKAGTEALETLELWNVDEVKREKGIAALRQGGDAAELMRKTKEEIFAA
ncbi:MAG TPA: type I restriction-modification enzyme R subunit C-terminal domain-containing protein [Gemmataceae bacterium]|nr:type I restriction-modification enzyme R subunit C-terminal domain-containing protein [Gemmataceae bacterium]